MTMTIDQLLRSWNTWVSKSGHHFQPEVLWENVSALISDWMEYR
jgi:hypothetical protein